MPEAIMIQEIEEPFVKTTVMLPSEYVGPVMQICQNKRAIFHNMSYIDPTRVSLVYDMPLAEIIIDFFDRLKSSTKVTPRSITTFRNIALLNWCV